MEYKVFPNMKGVLIVGRNKRVSSSVVNDGTKKIMTRKEHNSKLFENRAFLRGIIYFFVGFYIMIENLLSDFELSFIKKESREKVKVLKIILFSIFVGLFVFLLVLLFEFVPWKATEIVIGEQDIFVRNLFCAFLKVVMIYAILLFVSFLPVVNNLMKFNGASNVIFQTEKRKCYDNPLNFLNFIVFTFIFSSFVITLLQFSDDFFFNLFFKSLIFIICVSLSYELLNWTSKSNKLRKYFIATSCLVTRPPNTTHLEVTRTAFLEFTTGKGKNMELNKEKVPLSQVRSEMLTKLSKLGEIETSDLDWIIATILGKNRAEIKLIQMVDKEDYRAILKATEERAKGKPLSAIFGFVDFFGLKFNVNKKVLSPRMETEILVEEVLKETNERKKAKVLDVGTGSGAIAISVAKFSNAEVSAIDISKSALEVAKDNAKKNDAKVNFIQSDIFTELKKKPKYDIIVSNPPYIPTLDIEGLDGEVKNYDPRLALDGGDDGLDFYRRISFEAGKFLTKNGVILYEIGKGQYVKVKKILQDAGFENVKGIKDYNKIIRIVKAEWKK